MKDDTNGELDKKIEKKIQLLFLFYTQHNNADTIKDAMIKTSDTVF